MEWPGCCQWRDCEEPAFGCGILVWERPTPDGPERAFVRVAKIHYAVFRVCIYHFAEPIRGWPRR